MIKFSHSKVLGELTYSKVKAHYIYIYSYSETEVCIDVSGRTATKQEQVNKETRLTAMITRVDTNSGKRRRHLPLFDYKFLYYSEAHSWLEWCICPPRGSLNQHS